jgi:hypothetical protein
VVWSLAFLSLVSGRAGGQQATFNGQASAFWNVRPDSSLVSEVGLRYIPEFAVQDPVGAGDSLALDVSLNGLVIGTLQNGASEPLEAWLAAYRAWLRFSTHNFETRVGLQKISFGSATLFRPLMWFDRVDPRDPLQITDGVTGVLSRYYFNTNTNIWGWALYGNTTPTGWESTPTKQGNVEFGGRLQTPVPAGEVGLTYDHRETDLHSLASGAVAPEDRFGLDGKWNLAIGLWGEAALVHDHTNLLPYQNERFATLGADYTVHVGNGLYLLTETARFDTPSTPFGSGNGAWLSGVLGNYPIGILDRLSGIVYANWQAHQWYRILTWQRSYDAWTLYVVGFWNPEQPLGLGAAQFAIGTPQQSQAFAGRGVQLMAAFNY